MKNKYFICIASPPLWLTIIGFSPYLLGVIATIFLIVILVKVFKKQNINKNIVTIFLILVFLIILGRYSGMYLHQMWENSQPFPRDFCM